MSHDTKATVGRLFSEWTENRQQSVAEVYEAIFDELRRIAHAYMRRERPDHTLQTTALVNEAYLRLFQGQPFRWESRKHVFCTMAQAMRRVLIDHAKSHQALKHGGHGRRVSLEGVFLVSTERSLELIALDEALARLECAHPRAAHVVDLRFFGGLTVEETAALLDISPETVTLDWRFAKSWLERRLRSGTS